LVRIFLLNHVTWSVNSVCHTFGNKMFVTEDESRNNWAVGLLAMGEGWHNNHHAFPRSAFHGMRWYQFDMSSYIIWTMEKVGLVWNVQRVPPERMEARLARPRTAPTASAE
jgi:stearoyl-CoA desaturase (delta-9 desaturase)